MKNNSKKELSDTVNFTWFSNLLGSYSMTSDSLSESPLVKPHYIFSYLDYTSEEKPFYKN